LLSSSSGTCASTCTCIRNAGSFASEEEVDGRGFEEVVGDLVHVLYWSNDLGAHMPSAVSVTLQLAPCSAVGTFDEFGSRGVILLGGLWIDPLLDLYAAGAVVDPVRGIGGLVGDVAYLADNGHLAALLALPTYWTSTMYLRYHRFVDSVIIVATGLRLGI
jgi:hypothetical protein